MGIFEGKHISTAEYKRAGFTIFVKNFPKDFSDSILENACKKIGIVTSLAIPKFENGMNKGFLFCNYETHEDAVNAIDLLNGSLMGDQIITAVPFKSKEERFDNFCDEEIIEEEIFESRSEPINIQ